MRNHNPADPIRSKKKVWTCNTEAELLVACAGAAEACDDALLLVVEAARKVVDVARDDAAVVGDVIAAAPLTDVAAALLFVNAGPNVSVAPSSVEDVEDGIAGIDMVAISSSLRLEKFPHAIRVVFAK
jgi:hypothetical protein